MINTCVKMSGDPIGEKPCKFYIPEYKDGKNIIGFCSLASEFRCVEAGKYYSPQLSHSAIQDFTVCKLKYWYRYIRGLGVKPHMLSTALKMGKLWDTLQSVIYKIKTFDEVDEVIRIYRIPQYATAIVSAVYRAHKELIIPSTDNLIGLQKELFYNHWDNESGDICVHGFTDRLYTDYFVENKFTSYPENYTQKVFKIASQIGTYFLCDNKLEYVLMEIVRKPQLRQKTDESYNSFEDRILKDILIRPTNYFIGYNSKTKTYGVRFKRMEFETFINDISNRYRWIIQEIKDTMKKNSWYFCEQSCNLYGYDCDYLPICENGEGYASEERYEIRKRE